MTLRFSANLGFLWNDQPLVDRIHAAARAGFDAVECHWPYVVPAGDVAAALSETGLGMVALNTRRGDVAAGDNGLSAVPGRMIEARAAIDEAIAYARATYTGAVHVMAGKASGPEAQQTFVDNLVYACDAAASEGVAILIEPLNRYDAPGYFLNATGLAADIIEAVGRPNLRLMFDCYHVQIIEGDVTHRLQKLLPLIGHIQIASVPDRGAPDHGELDYDHVLRRIVELGWTAPIGAEYRHAGQAGPDLEWLQRYSGKKIDATITEFPNSTKKP